MQAFEFHRLDEIVQLAADAHGNDEGGALEVGPRHAALLELGDLLCREWPAGEQREPGVMDGDRGIGRDFAGRGAEKQIAAGRIAHGITGREFGLDFPARRLDLEAGRVDLASSGAGGCDGASDPGCGLPAAEQAGDDIGWPDRAARRIKIDRPTAVLDVAQETADARGRPLIDLTFDRDPAIATRTARIGRAPGIVDDQPGCKSGLFSRCFGTHLAVNQQQGCEKEKAKHHDRRDQRSMEAMAQAKARQCPPTPQPLVAAPLTVLERRT